MSPTSGFYAWWFVAAMGLCGLYYLISSLINLWKKRDNGKREIRNT